VSPEALDYWARAAQALQTAESLIDRDPDASSSRAYYAAFYAVSALFALEQVSHTKHTAVERAVHRDLVKPGRWSVELARPSPGSQISGTPRIMVAASMCRKKTRSLPSRGLA
jgi:uncharacterized protein (UPF0332 family)